MLESSVPLKPDFEIAPEFKDIRILTRHRLDKVSDLAREKNFLRKHLSECGVWLDLVVKDVHGQDARRMINCLIEGGSAEDALALAEDPLNVPQERLIMALEGNLTDSRRGLLKINMDSVLSLESVIADFDDEILSRLAPYQERLRLLQTIPGVSEISAALILAEIGTDMSIFQSRRQMASWAGFCPGPKESAGERKRGGLRNRNRWIRQVLREVAKAAVIADPEFKAKFDRMYIRQGYNKSIIHLAHKILRILYAVMKKNEPYSSNIAYSSNRDN
jgi:transposase